MLKNLIIGIAFIIVAGVSFVMGVREHALYMKSIRLPDGIVSRYGTCYQYPENLPSYYKGGRNQDWKENGDQ